MFKVWNLTNCKLKTNHYGHTAYINSVTVSPDGSLCASGGKDGQAMLWDLSEGTCCGSAYRVMIYPNPAENGTFKKLS